MMKDELCYLLTYFSLFFYNSDLLHQLVGRHTPLDEKQIHSVCPTVQIPTTCRREDKCYTFPREVMPTLNLIFFTID